MSTTELVIGGVALVILFNVWVVAAGYIWQRRGEANHERVMAMMVDEPTDEQLYDAITAAGFVLKPRGEWLAARKDQLYEPNDTYPACPQCGGPDTHPTDLGECTCHDCGCVYDVDLHTNRVTVITPRSWYKYAPAGPAFWLAVVAAVLLLGTILVQCHWPT